MTRTNSPTGSAGWLRHATASSPFLNRLNIHRRLTLCFIFIIVLMLIGNGVLLWQLHLISAQVERLNGVNEELIEVLRVHTGLLSAYERLGAAARSEDSGRLLKEWATLRAGLAEDAQRTQAAFSHLPPEVNADQTVLPTLESIERALPSHLDAIRALAASGEWEAVRIRIEVQVQPLESLSSELVKDVAREVEEQRAQATLNISRAERRIFLAVPITGFVTLLIAAGLGVAITRSITEPLGRLVEGSKALARGEFQHQVSVIGQDELAQLGQVFNVTAGRLQNLYENLRKSEANLAEAQRLSHTGSWNWDVASKRIFWSAEMFNIFGFDPRTTTPTPENYLQRIHPDDRAPIDAAASELYKGNDAEYNYRIVLPDNSTRYVRTIAHAITNDSGQVIEFVGTVIDVTEQRNARKALEKAFEEIKTLKDQLYKENLALREEIDKVSMFEDIVGTSPALQAVLSRVSKVAPTDSTVLVTGETGTGKELVARAIHKRSHRSLRAFVSVNCAAIPRDLITSELFGHEKGAFTVQLSNVRAALNWPKEARSFSMRSGSSPPRPKSLSCVFCRNTNLSVSVELDPSKLTFGSLPLRTAIWRLPSLRACSGAICFTGSTFSQLRCLPCAKEEKIFPSSSGTSSIVLREEQESTFRRLVRRALICCRRIPGRAIFASCRT